MTKKKNQPDKKARVHKDLEGFEIGISPTGQVVSNFTHEQLNEFLNKHVRDKKLTDEQKSEQDDRMFPIQRPNDAEEEEDEEAFFRNAPKGRKGKKAAPAAEPTDDAPADDEPGGDDDGDFDKPTQ